MARGCHKSAYHGVYLRNIKLSYLWPPYLEECAAFDAVEPGQVQRALEEEPDIGAVLIVSPTYEGRMADIAAIAEIVHKKNIPLIVDEAHGAHLGLAEGFGENSCRLGADLVIHSVHKTLPALTQTALLHVNGNLIDRGLLRRFLNIYQSSSPSYLLMASIDNALEYVELQGEEAFRRFKRQYEEMEQCLLSGCRHLRFPCIQRGIRREAGGRGSSPGQDVGKLLISLRETGLTGKQFYDILLQEYRLQLEMAAEDYVLAMFTVNDGEEAYRRMARALLETDALLAGFRGREKRMEHSQAAPEKECRPGAEAVSLAAAWDMPGEMILLEESIGRCAGEFIGLYPPGIPLLVPGERMEEALCRYIRRAVEQGLNVQGVETAEEGSLHKKRVYVRMLAEYKK